MKRPKGIGIIFLVVVVAELVGLIGCGGGGSISPSQPSCSPKLLRMPFERLVQAFPVGVEIRYPPNIHSHDEVLIFASRPLVGFNCCQVTTAMLITSTSHYSAIPVAEIKNDEIKVRWWYVDHNDRLLPLESLDEPLQLIVVQPVVQ